MSDFPTAKGAIPPEIVNRQLALEQAKGLSKQKLPSEKEIDKATTGFEALLLHEMMQAMWETVEPTGLLGEDSNQAQIYRDMLNQAVADSIASGRGIGVKQMIKQEILRRERASKE